MTNTILFFAFVLLAIVVGTRLKWNVGLVALAFAFVLGPACAGLTASGVIALFPTSLFFNFFLTTYLFGFAGSNGTLQKVAAWLLYFFRNARWAVGLMFFIITVLVSLLGAGGSAPFFLSAVCFGLAAQAGINPLLVSVALWTGSMVGGGTPWSSGYATNCGQLEIYFDTATSSSYVYGFFAWRAIFYTILYLALFLILRGYRTRGAVTVERPEKLDNKQKITLYVIVAVIVAVLVSSLLPLLLPATSVVCSKISFQLAAVIGILINIGCSTADNRQVLTQRVPWETLIMLSTMGIYMGLANSMGVVEYLTDILQYSIPSHWILPGLVLIMGVLSFFVSGSVVVPLILPLLSALSSASGVSVAAIYAAAQMGLTASSISPFSQGGAAVLTGCQDETLRNRLVRQQVIMSVVITVLLTVIAALGGFQMLNG